MSQDPIPDNKKTMNWKRLQPIIKVKSYLESLHNKSEIISGELRELGVTHNKSETISGELPELGVEKKDQ